MTRIAYNIKLARGACKRFSPPSQTIGKAVFHDKNWASTTGCFDYPRKTESRQLTRLIEIDFGASGGLRTRDLPLSWLLPTRRLLTGAL
jgi:hypothetical protein